MARRSIRQLVQMQIRELMAGHLHIPGLPKLAPYAFMRWMLHDFAYQGRAWEEELRALDLEGSPVFAPVRVLRDATLVASARFGKAIKKACRTMGRIENGGSGRFQDMMAIREFIDSELEFFALRDATFAAHKSARRQIANGNGLDGVYTDIVDYARTSPDGLQIFPRKPSVG